MPNPKAHRRGLAAVAALLASGLALTGCNSSTGGGGGAGSAAEFPSQTIDFLVPSGAGGGWDSTARAMQKVMENRDMVKESVEVFNVEGGGGATGLSQLQKEEGDPHAWMMTGLVMIGALEQADSPVSLDNTTPLAILTSEAEAFVVPAGSPFKSIEDVVKAYEKNPKAVRFGGGSAGGSDQLVVGELLNTANLDAGAMNYVGYPGGGEAIAGILSGDVQVGVSGVSEFEGQIESGDMRLLAVSTADPVEVAGEKARTLQDAGYDVDFSNWRAVVAAPGVDPKQRDQVIALLDELHSSDAWERQLKINGWSDAYRTGDEAQAFIDQETKRVSQLYEDLGL